jgi:DNA-binding transcriptional ArsR family regulator
MGGGNETGDVFAAISTPVRREILALLAASELPVTTLAESFDMTLSAVSQHLGVLRDAGLVNVRKDGKQRLYRLDPAPLRTVAEWVDQYGPMWTEKLTKLGEYLDETSKENP